MVTDARPDAQAHLDEAARAIAAMLQGDPPPGDFYDMERFGRHQDTVNACMLALAAYGASNGRSHDRAQAGLAVRAVWEQRQAEEPTLADAVAVLTGEAPPAARWQVCSLADAYRPRDPVVEMVDGLLPRPSLAIVYGPPGSLKSLLLLDLLLCIAGGLAWLPPLDASEGVPRGVRQAPVLWVDFDNGPRRTHERVAAVARAYGLAMEVPFHYVSMPSPWLDAGQLGGLAPLATAIAQYAAKVVVIDNLLLIKVVNALEYEQLLPSKMSTCPQS
jgi:AAA domain-containing protein